MDRNERAAYLREMRSAARESREIVTHDQFLKEWLAEIEQVYRELIKESHSDEVQAELAERAGYRSFRALQAAREDVVRLHRNFVHAEPFKKLWAIMKESESSDVFSLAYSASPAGVPNRLINATLAWHQAPKFTEKERREHSKKIAQACQALEDLLGQVEPSHQADQQYSRFRFADESQAKAIIRFLKPSSNNDKRTRHQSPAPWTASFLLSQCGVVPLWAVRNIKAMALDGQPMTNPLPAKVKAKGAKKTFFIGAVLKAIDMSVVFLPDLNVKPQLIADIVELMSGMDCTADDVRKAKADWMAASARKASASKDPEDSRS